MTKIPRGKHICPTYLSKVKDKELLAVQVEATEVLFQPIRQILALLFLKVVNPTIKKLSSKKIPQEH